MTTLTLRFEPNLEESILALACAQHKSKSGKSQFVRDYLRRETAVQQFKRTRASLLPYGAKVGILTDKDVFEAIS